MQTLGVVPSAQGRPPTRNIAVKLLDPSSLGLKVTKSEPLASASGFLRKRLGLEMLVIMRDVGAVMFPIFATWKKSLKTCTVARSDSIISKVPFDANIGRKVLLSVRRRKKLEYDAFTPCLKVPPSSSALIVTM